MTSSSTPTPERHGGPDAQIAVVISSTRPTRICPVIAQWTRRTLAELDRLDYALIDLAEVGLPMLDEPRPAALGTYEHDHSRQWSQLITGFAGFVFVAPQYNWGYPAVLKNALDYLYFEWRDKPVSTVTYGTRGGGRAADQLAGVFSGLHMRTLPGRLEVKITEADVDADWQIADIETLMTPYREQLRELDAQMLQALQMN